MKKEFYKKTKVFFIIIFLLYSVFFLTTKVYSLEPTTNCMNEVNANTNCIRIISGIFPQEASTRTEVDAIQKSIILQNTGISENELKAVEDKLYKEVYYKITSSDDLNKLDEMLRNGELTINLGEYNKKYCTYRSKKPWVAFVDFTRKYIDEDGNVKEDKKSFEKNTNFVCKDTIAPRIKVDEKLAEKAGEKTRITINITDDENTLLPKQKDSTYLSYYKIQILDFEGSKIKEYEKTSLGKKLSDIFSLELSPEECKGQCKIIFTGKDNNNNVNESYEYLLTPRYLSLDGEGYCIERNLCYVGGNNKKEFSFKNTLDVECVSVGENYNDNYCSNIGWVSKSRILLGNVLSEEENYDNVNVYCNAYDQIFNPESKAKIEYCTNDFENNDVEYCDQSCISLMYNNIDDYKVFYSQSYNENKDFKGQINIPISKTENGLGLNDILNIDVLTEATKDVFFDEQKEILFYKDKNLIYDYKNKYLLYGLMYDNIGDYNLNSEKSLTKANSVIKEDIDYMNSKVKEYYNSIDYFTTKLDENFSRVYFTPIFAYKRISGKKVMGSVIKLKDKNGIYTDPIIILYYKGFNDEDKSLIKKVFEESIINPKMKMKNIKFYEDNNNLLIIGLSNEDVMSEQLERYVVRLRLNRK